jgi:hypothetical protein
MFGANFIVYVRLTGIDVYSLIKKHLHLSPCLLSAVNTGVKRRCKSEVMQSVFMTNTRIGFPCVDQAYTLPNHNNVTVTGTCCSSFVSIALPPVFIVAASASDLYAPPPLTSLEFLPNIAVEYIHLIWYKHLVFFICLCTKLLSCVWSVSRNDLWGHGGKYSAFIGICLKHRSSAGYLHHLQPHLKILQFARRMYSRV